MSYEIENNVPLPPESAAVPLAKMKPGQSIFVEDSPPGRSARVRRMTYWFARSLGIKVTTRKEVGGLRIWRAS